MVLRQVSRYINKFKERLRGCVLVVHHLGYHHFILAAAILHICFLLIVAGIVCATSAIGVQRPRLQLLPAIVQLYQHSRHGGEIDKEQRYDE